MLNGRFLFHAQGSLTVQEMIPHLTWTMFEDKGAPPLHVHRATREQAQAPTVLHTHEFSELVLILGGSGIHVTERERYPVVAGDVFLIEGSQAHGYRDTEDLRLVNLFFDKKSLKLPLYDIPEMPGFHALFTLAPKRRGQSIGKSLLHLSVEDLGRVEAWVDSMEYELRTRAPGYRFMAATLFMRILGHLCRCCSKEEAHSSQSILRLGEVISCIEKNHAERTSLKDLCKVAHMSESTLLRHFHQALGLSPIDYLIRLRIRKASELLRQTSLSITQVAFQVGFSDSNYFSRQFRKVAGHSPREFRKQSSVPLLFGTSIAGISDDQTSLPKIPSDSGSSRKRRWAAKRRPQDAS